MGVGRDGDRGGGGGGGGSSVHLTPPAEVEAGFDGHSGLAYLIPACLVWCSQLYVFQMESVVSCLCGRQVESLSVKWWKGE